MEAYATIGCLRVASGALRTSLAFDRDVFTEGAPEEEELELELSESESEDVSESESVVLLSELDSDSELESEDDSEEDTSGLLGFGTEWDCVLPSSFLVRFFAGLPMSELV